MPNENQLVLHWLLNFCGVSDLVLLMAFLRKGFFTIAPIIIPVMGNKFYSIYTKRSFF